MRPSELRMTGAVDLSALRNRATAPPPPAADASDASGAPAEAGPLLPVIDVTEANFEAEVILRSQQVPVVLDFWAEWCGPCKQLSPILERLAVDADGAWVLAKIDVDANERLAAAFQVQSIPTVYAVIAGQPVPLFQGAVGEQQVLQVMDEVLRVAAQQGLPGGDGSAAEQGPPPTDPDMLRAQEALQTGDIDAALAAYNDLLERNPNDAQAKVAVARCELLQRTRGADEDAVRRTAAAQPDDLGAQGALADLEMVRGRVDEALRVMLDLVRRTSGDDRDRARARLLALFDSLDAEDPRLARARRDLASALF